MLSYRSPGFGWISLAALAFLAILFRFLLPESELYPVAQLISP
jgi:hypothetical protein